MVLGDRDRWDTRYADASVGRPVAFVAECADALPRAGRALDIAGGTGATAIELARRGLEVTLLDVSPVALSVAQAEADRLGLSLATLQADLDSDPLPAGPFDVVVCANFLDRGLLGSLAHVMAHDGLLMVVVATVTNLERNPRPSRRYLVEPGELPGLIDPRIRPVSYGEGWFGDRHEARFAGRRR